MEFIRINEHMVKCEVTEDDLMEFNVSIEDFFTRSEGAMELLHEIVRQAEIAVDYKPDGPLTTLQIAPAGKNGLTIFLTEQQKFDLTSLLRGLKDFGGVPIDEEVFRQLDGSTGEEQMGFFKRLLENVKREVERSSGNPKMLPKESDAAKSGRMAVSMSSDNDRVRVFSFKRIGDVMNYASSLKRYKGFKNALYKSEEDGMYYLVIERGRLTIDSFAEVILTAHEYGRFVSDRESYVVFIKEHCECIIPSQAIAKIRG